MAISNNNLWQCSGDPFSGTCNDLLNVTDSIWSTSTKGIWSTTEYVDPTEQKDDIDVFNVEMYQRIQGFIK